MIQLRVTLRESIVRLSIGDGPCRVLGCTISLAGSNSGPLARLGLRFDRDKPAAGAVALDLHDGSTRRLRDLFGMRRGVVASCLRPHAAGSRHETTEGKSHHQEISEVLNNSRARANPTFYRQRASESRKRSTIHDHFRSGPTRDATRPVPKSGACHTPVP